jgi:hypothetical protein
MPFSNKTNDVCGVCGGNATNVTQCKHDCDHDHDHDDDDGDCPTATLKLYKDRDFIHQAHVFEDGDKVCALLTLQFCEEQQGLTEQDVEEFVAERIVICVPPPGGQLIPFNVSNPERTGCYTPGTDRHVLYPYGSSLFNPREHVFELTFKLNPPSSVMQVGFCFRAKTLSVGLLDVQVHWRALIDTSSAVAAENAVVLHNGHHGRWFGGWVLTEAGLEVRCPKDFDYFSEHFGCQHEWVFKGRRFLREGYLGWLWLLAVLIFAIAICFGLCVPIDSHGIWVAAGTPVVPASQQQQQQQQSQTVVVGPSHEEHQQRHSKRETRRKHHKHHHRHQHDTQRHAKQA